jgi:tetratricopeptide (TPR) repeat protein
LFPLHILIETLKKGSLYVKRKDVLNWVKPSVALPCFCLTTGARWHTKSAFFKSRKAGLRETEIPLEPGGTEIENVQWIKIKEKTMSKAKNVEEFIAKQRAAIAFNPDCGTSHYNLAVALLGQKKYDEAEKELQEAISCSPTLAEAYVQLGGICLQRGDLDGCLAYNQQAVNSRAGFSEGWGNIGFVYLQKGEVDKAIDALEKATKWNPNFIQAYATLANAYLMKGLVDKSIDINLKIIQLEPTFAVAYNNLAIAYLEKGEFELASEHCNKAIELGYNVAPEITAEIAQHQKRGK